MGHTAQYEPDQPRGSNFATGAAAQLRLQEVLPWEFYRTVENFKPEDLAAVNANGLRELLRCTVIMY